MKEGQEVSECKEMAIMRGSSVETRESVMISMLSATTIGLGPVSMQEWVEQEQN